ncbi:MAG: hypothetical protein Q9184_007417 [Pyrenodesmia sp. 2 TL-2023]
METTVKKKRGRPPKARRTSSSPSPVAGEQRPLLDGPTPSLGPKADAQAIDITAAAKTKAFTAGSSLEENQGSPTLAQDDSTSSVPALGISGDDGILAGMKLAAGCDNMTDEEMRYHLDQVSPDFLANARQIALQLKNKLQNQPESANYHPFSTKPAT